MTNTLPGLTYNSEFDSIVDGHGFTPVWPDDFIEVSAATSAGRSVYGGGQKTNEDAYGVIYRDGILSLAIFDGASSQKPIPELSAANISGARFASHTLKALFDASEPREPVDMLQQLNRELGRKLKKFTSVDYSDLNSLPTSTATIIQVDRAKGMLTTAHVGDSFAATVDEDGRTLLLTNNLHRPYDEEVLELMAKIARESGKTVLEARQEARVGTAIMKMFQGTRNRPDGTGEGMVNGDPNMDQYIHSTSLPIAGLRGLLAGSDGLVRPDLDERIESDRVELMSAAMRYGVRQLIGQTHKIQDADPQRQLYVRYKHSDDATGVRLRFARNF